MIKVYLNLYIYLFNRHIFYKILIHQIIFNYNSNNE